MKHSALVNGLVRLLCRCDVCDRVLPVPARRAVWSRGHVWREHFATKAESGLSFAVSLFGRLVHCARVGSGLP